MRWIFILLLIWPTAAWSDCRQEGDLMVCTLPDSFACPKDSNCWTTGLPTVQAAPMLKCPDGYTLMADLMLKPKCVKDVIEPSYDR